MMTEKLNFPIIVFFENGDFHPYPLKKDFLLTDRQSILNGQYNNVSIIDSTGNKYHIQNHHITKPYGFFGGYHPFFKSRLFWVKLELIWKKKYSLEQLKVKISNALKTSKIPDSVTINLEEQIETIDFQKNIRDLISKLNE